MTDAYPSFRLDIRSHDPDSMTMPQPPMGSIDREGTIFADDNTDTLGRLLREARLLSIEELAARTGVSVRAISDLERGRTRKPYPRTVRLLSAAQGLASRAGGQVPNGQVDSGAAADDLREGRNPGWLSHARVSQPSELAGSPEQNTSKPSQRHGLVPRKPSAALPYFTGRAADMDELARLLHGAGVGTAVVICVIAGTASIGRTAAADA